MSELVDYSFMLREKRPWLVVKLEDAERVLRQRDERIAELERKLTMSCSYCRAGIRRSHSKGTNFHWHRGKRVHCSSLGDHNIKES